MPNIRVYRSHSYLLCPWVLKARCSFLCSLSVHVPWLRSTYSPLDRWQYGHVWGHVLEHSRYPQLPDVWCSTGRLGHLWIYWWVWLLDIIHALIHSEQNVPTIPPFLTLRRISNSLIMFNNVTKCYRIWNKLCIHMKVIQTRSYVEGGWHWGLSIHSRETITQREQILRNHTDGTLWQQSVASTWVSVTPSFHTTTHCTTRPIVQSTK